ncbi:dienelactone hydrolase [Phaeosphaeria sp. MPI-PUGE-AT-0046c]|nr:dienelactone hydrolase [Phaeosphaeria sp. MPI-PUGE-AT-0046c]
MDPVLAKPADLCCIQGAIHDGVEQGKVEDVDGIPTYVAVPKDGTANGNILLFFPDAFGLHINSYLIMDSFAACGYLTLGVDYFLGDGVGKHSKTPLSDPNFNFPAWKDKHLLASEEVAARWITSIQAKYGKAENVNYACVGYCWGARFVCKQLSSSGICKAGAIAHPSFMNESHVSGIKAPIYFSVLNTDKLFEPDARSRTVEILTKENKRFNMQIFSDVGHGFATRAQLSDPYERWAKEQSFKSFVDWFDAYLPKKVKGGGQTL